MRNANSIVDGTRSWIGELEVYEGETVRCSLGRWFGAQLYSVTVTLTIGVENAGPLPKVWVGQEMPRWGKK
jgi:hypothetical protein